MENIKQIDFPNTVAHDEIESFRIGKSCDEIKPVTKAGEMSGIQWFEIWRKGEKIAEIKESVCNIYFI